MKNPLKFILIIAFVLLSSCENSSPDDLTEPIIDASYTGSIKTIIDSSCVRCHGSPLQNGATFSIATYDELVNAVGQFPIIARMSSAGNPMPPSGKLPDTTVELVNQWIMNGFPE